MVRKETLALRPPSLRIVAVEDAEKIITAPNAISITVAVSRMLYSIGGACLRALARTLLTVSALPFDRRDVVFPDSGRRADRRPLLLSPRSGIESPDEHPEAVSALLVVAKLIEAGTGR
jgi:hypothetical protein